MHGPPMLVDKTNFGLVLYNHTNFYRFEETPSYCFVKRISIFLCFSLVNQWQTSSITVYNQTVTSIENTVRVMHSCSGWLLDSFYIFSMKLCWPLRGWMATIWVFIRPFEKRLYYVVPLGIRPSVCLSVRL